MFESRTSLAVIVGVLIAAPAAADGDNPSAVLANGNLRTGGEFVLRVSTRAYEHTVCWESMTTYDHLALPPLPVPVVTWTHNAARCDVRPEASRFGPIILDRRCDADTSLVAGTFGRSIATVAIQPKKGEQQRATLDRASIGGRVERGFHALLPSSVQSAELVALDARHRKRTVLRVRWPKCFDPEHE
jgi:hypothetical protein